MGLYRYIFELILTLTIPRKPGNLLKLFIFIYLERFLYFSIQKYIQFSNNFFKINLSCFQACIPLMMKEDSHQHFSSPIDIIASASMLNWELGKLFMITASLSPDCSSVFLSSFRISEGNVIISSGIVSLSTFFICSISSVKYRAFDTY